MLHPVFWFKTRDFHAMSTWISAPKSAPLLGRPHTLMDGFSVPDRATHRLSHGLLRLGLIALVIVGLMSKQDTGEKSTVTLDAAMALYDLHSFELLWEKALDTKVLIMTPAHSSAPDPYPLHCFCLNRAQFLQVLLARRDPLNIAGLAGLERHDLRALLPRDHQLGKRPRGPRGGRPQP